MEIPKEVLAIIDIIEKHKFEAYVVGGFVRDSILGRDSYDIDIATNGRPEDMKNIFASYRIIRTGIKHGTITVILEDVKVEITTYRVDGEYKDKRHPDSVSFSSNIQVDMLRRDFTINALGYNPKEGIIDYVGGQKDLENKLIRTVGNAEERLMEDGLRILRGLRFASELNFVIEKNTEQAMFRCRSLLKNISPERKLGELRKLLVGAGVKDVLVRYKEVLDFVIPNIAFMDNVSQNCKYHIYNVLEHTALAVESIEPIFHLRLTMLLHDIGKIKAHTTDANGVDHFKGHGKYSVDMASEFLDFIKLDKKTKLKVITLIKYHDSPIECSEICIKQWLNSLGSSLFFDLIKVKKADCIAKSSFARKRIEYIENLEAIGKKIIERGDCFSLDGLAINGDDLIKVGVSSGIKIGENLEQLLKMVINNQVENNKEALLNILKLHDCN
ncbi:MAG: CCA tRNA nucleotidyltransferase [Filifactoraceae bacterium]